MPRDHTIYRADPQGEASEIRTPEDAISFFNRNHCVVSEAGKTIILRERYDHLLRRRVFDRMRISDLRALYANRLIETGRKRNGEPVYTPIVEIWFRSPHRRTYAGGVIFDPSGA